MSMKHFKSYYKERFRADLSTFLNTIPKTSRYHNNIGNRDEITIQLERLTSNHKHLDFLSMGTKLNFAHALFWTILVDMTMYSHFKLFYNSFRKVTYYPKLIGNCPGGCYHHYHPRNIYYQMELLNEDETIKALILPTMAFMKLEIESFLTEYLPEINISDFLNKIDKELR